MGMLPPEVESAAQNPSHVFDKFVKVQLLGKGGAGVVWKCYDRGLSRYVAVKFLEGAGEAVTRFVREARIAARLEHPNICRVYESGTWQGQPYIVMQYIAGRRLLEQKIALTDGLRCVAKVAHAIHYAHERGVLHRDIKPGNIMIDAKNEVYVLDFGLAKQLEAGPTISVSGVIMGTPAYMSPEQARGEVHTLNARSDVYALGATLYEVVTGKLPFEGTTILDLVNKVQAHDPVSPRKINRQIPAEVETIILKAMEKNPDRRYRSAREFAEDIERFLRGEPILARRSSVLYRLAKRVKRQPLVYAGFGLAALIALTAGAFAAGAHLQRRAELRRSLEDGMRRLAAGDLQGAHEAAVRARQIDVKAAEPLWVLVQEKLQKEAAERERQRREQAEREAIDPLIRKLTNLELAAPGDMRAQIRELMEQAQTLVKQHPDWGGAWLTAGWSKRLMYRYGGRALLEEARRELDAAVERTTSMHRADALYQRGMLYADLVRERVNEFFGTITERGSRWTREFPKDAETQEHVRRALQDLRARTTVETNEWGKAYGEGLLLYLQGKFAEALKRLQGIGTIDALLLRAQCSFYGFGETGSRQEVEAVAELTGRLDALYLACIMNMAERRTARARELIDKLKDLDPKNPVHWNHRGLTRAAEGDMDGAIQDYTQALNIAPRFSGALHNRGTARAAKGDFRGAIEDYTAALRSYPDFALSYLNRANAYSKLKKLSDAMADYNRAIELDPQLLDAYYGRGNLKRESGDHRGAIVDYSKVLELDANHAEALNHRGVSRAALGDYAEAIEDYTRAVELKPDLAFAWNNRGLARMHQGDLEQALTDISKAIEVNPKYAEAYFNRAIVKDARRDPTGALRDYTRSIELNPDDPDTYLNRGLLYLRVGEPKAALRDMDRAVALAPQNPNVYYNRASVRGTLGKIDGAIEDLTRVLELAPEDVDACLRRGLMHTTAKNFEAAEADFTRALTIDAHSFEAFASRGIVREAMGKKQEARQDLERALQLAPKDWPNRDQIQQALERLKR